MAVVQPVNTAALGSAFKIKERNKKDRAFQLGLYGEQREKLVAADSGWSLSSLHLNLILKET